MLKIEVSVSVSVSVPGFQFHDAKNLFNVKLVK